MLASSAHSCAFHCPSSSSSSGVQTRMYSRSGWHNISIVNDWWNMSAAAEAEVDCGFFTAKSMDELGEQIHIVVGGGTVSV